MPPHRWPKWCDFKTKMANSRIKPTLSCRPPVFLMRTGYRFHLVFAVMAIYGCSSPQPIAQLPWSESTPVVSSVVSIPPAVTIITPATEEKAIAAVSDDNYIFFPPGLTLVGDAGNKKLRTHADCLKQNPKKFVTLIGFADDSGSRSVNLAMTEQRLTAVSKVLRAYGVSPRQIRRNRTASVKKPAACTLSDCRQQVSRVELVYSP
jgi:outer membrane protein OmpA-like peptidoglycan-associated protein